MSEESAEKRELDLAKTELKRAKKEQQTFLANISHEIRTPLNGILGMAQLLLNQDLPEKNEKYVRAIYRSSEVLLALVNDLLDLSALEQGHLKIEKVNFSIPELLQEIVMILANDALEKGIALRLYCPPGTPLIVRGDPIRIKEILITLVENGIKFTKQGEVILGIIPDPLEFFVSDTGEGISKEIQSRIFEKFVQSTESTRKYKGTGLGLSISHSLIKKMGGKIDFKSKEGKGTVFSFTIPFEVIPTPPLLSNEARASFKGKRILIISQSEVKSFIYSQATRWAGMVTVTANSCEEGLEILQKSRFSNAPFSFCDVLR